MSEPILRPVEGQRDVAFPGGRVTLASPTYKLRDHNGRTHLMEWHSYLGPTFLKKDGDPLARYPSEKHPLWKAFNLWWVQGRLVDQDDNCIWRDATPAEVDLTKPRRPADELTMERVKALMKVSLAPGAWDKTFIRGMASMTVAPAPKFTDAQVRHISRLCRKYHRQVEPRLVPAEGEWL